MRTALWMAVAVEVKNRLPTLALSLVLTGILTGLGKLGIVVPGGTTRRPKGRVQITNTAQSYVLASIRGTRSRKCHDPGRRSLHALCDVATFVNITGECNEDTITVPGSHVGGLAKRLLQRGQVSWQSGQTVGGTGRE